MTDKPKKPDPLYKQAIFAAAKGDLDLDAFGAMNEVMSGGSPVKPVKDGMGTQPIQMVTDINGDTLVAGKLYKIPLLNGREGRTIRARVLREEYGAGNALDTYYRLYYMDDTLKEQMVVIQGRGGVFGPASYPSKIEPIEE